MTITEQYTDAAGKIRMVVLLSNGESVMLKFNEQPTTTALNDIEANYIDNVTVERLPQMQYQLLGNKDLFKELVTAIKAKPTMTLANYTTYISTRQWYEQAMCNFFLYTVGMGLAEKFGVSMANYTQTTIWTQVRNWIVATPAKNIARILFGE